VCRLGRFAHRNTTRSASGLSTSPKKATGTAAKVSLPSISVRPNPKSKIFHYAACRRETSSAICGLLVVHSAITRSIWLLSRSSSSSKAFCRASNSSSRLAAGVSLAMRARGSESGGKEMQRRTISRKHHRPPHLLALTAESIKPPGERRQNVRSCFYRNSSASSPPFHRSHSSLWSHPRHSRNPRFLKSVFHPCSSVDQRLCRLPLPLREGRGEGSETAHLPPSCSCSRPSS
jgi:hypothetical protein